MSLINPITELNTYAVNMVKATAKNAPAKTTYIRNFLRTANDNNIQGTAIVSFFTAARNATNDIASKDKNIKNRLKNIVTLIIDEINGIPELKKQANKFVQALVKNYDRQQLAKYKNREVDYNTLHARIFLAVLGLVKADGIESPKTFKYWIKKMFARVDLMWLMCKSEE